ncbi:MAG: hypothetical protein VB092_06860 [Oscillospiraceae bacterium]|nr:hypothetical protein [Oscillospiraceae bacterium]
MVRAQQGAPSKKPVDSASTGFFIFGITHPITHFSFFGIIGSNVRKGNITRINVKNRNSVVAGTQSPATTENGFHNSYYAQNSEKVNNNQNYVASDDMQRTLNRYNELMAQKGAPTDRAATDNVIASPQDQLFDDLDKLDATKKAANAERAARSGEKSDSKIEIADNTMTDELSSAFSRIKILERERDKAVAKNRLTENDKIIVESMLRGLIDNANDGKIQPDNIESIAAVYEAKKNLQDVRSITDGYKAKLNALRRNVASELIENSDNWKGKIRICLFS